jgi:4-alpha-glucanotransferase
VTTHPVDQKSGWLDRRRTGLLLPLSSLLSGAGNGVIGAPAHHFLRFLADSGASVWQMLPVHPPDTSGSPYQGNSAHAGDPRLICRAAGSAETAGLPEFRRAQSAWLEDFALYCALKQHLGSQPWWQWPPEFRDRKPAALGAFRRTHASEIAQYCSDQHLFFSQWQRLRKEAAKLGILLLGDMPLFVSHDSADVWANQKLFQLDKTGQPIVVAGVPPDYYSATGQRWGIPVYNWGRHASQGFAWWINRVRTELELFDVIRIDHFRGLDAVWEIPSSAPTAESGVWRPAPGRELLRALHAAFGPLPFLAEDLGTITQPVIDLRREFSVPGIRVLQFAFDGSAANPYLPHNHEPDSAVYTGTHDNNTTLGWFKELDTPTQQRVLEYLGLPSKPMPWPLVDAALASVCRLAVIPVQDLLALGSAHRMNTPGSVTGNWQWKLPAKKLTPDLAARMRHLNQIYGRS